MVEHMREPGTSVWRVESGGGHRREIIYSKSGQLNWSFFVRRL